MNNSLLNSLLLCSFLVHIKEKKKKVKMDLSMVWVFFIKLVIKRSGNFES